MTEAVEKCLPIPAVPDVVADHSGLVPVEQHEVAAIRILERLGRRSAGLLVLYLAVDHGGVSVLCVADHVLPDVQHRPARRVHEGAPLRGQLRHLRDRHAEGGENDDVVCPKGFAALGGVGEESDAAVPQPVVDVWVVDDLAGEEHVPARKSPPGLVGVVHGPVDSVAEAELAREMDRQPAGLEPVVRRTDAVHDRAVVRRRQLAGDGLLHVEAFTEDHRLCRCQGDPISGGRSRASLE